jgi:hypothetical protein
LYASSTSIARSSELPNTFGGGVCVQCPLGK